MPEYSRAALAKEAGLTVRQLDYLAEQGAVAPDVGGERKQYSVREARLAVVCGAALSTGVSPKALPGPVGWLRNAVLFPQTIELPSALNDIALELKAERYRGLHHSLPKGVKIGNQREGMKSLAELFAAEVYANDYGADPLSATLTDSKKEFADANAGNDLAKANAAKALAKATDMLSVPPKWDIDTLRQVETALNFELACRDKKSFFLHMLAHEDTWRVRLHTELTTLEDQHVWLVIDLRRLFRSRGMTA